MFEVFSPESSLVPTSQIIKIHPALLILRLTLEPAPSLLLFHYIMCCHFPWSGLGRAVSVSSFQGVGS